MSAYCRQWKDYILERVDMSMIEAGKVSKKKNDIMCQGSYVSNKIIYKDTSCTG